MAYRKDLNFIPEYRDKDEPSAYLWLIFLIIILGLVIFGGGILLPNWYKESQVKLKNDLSGKELKYIADAIKYDKLTNDRVFLSKKLNTLKSLGDSYISAATIISELEKALPEVVEIRKYNLDQTHMVIDAAAPQNFDIAELYTRISSSDWFSELQLSAIVTTQDLTMKEFTMTVRLVNAPQEESGKDVEE